MKEIKTELESLANNYIKFIEFDSTLMNNIKSMSKKITLCSNKFDCDTDFCMKNEDESCSLIIPITNLITQQNNEEIYYTKFADEFIRNSKIRSFLFESKNYLTFNNIKYDINDNEVILFHSYITSSLFNNKIIIKNNYDNYTNHNTFFIDSDKTFDAIDTTNYKFKASSIKLDSIQQNKKMKITLPKIQLDAIQEYSKQEQKNFQNKKLKLKQKLKQKLKLKQQKVK